MSKPPVCFLVVTLSLSGCVAACDRPGASVSQFQDGSADRPEQRAARGLVGRVTWSGPPEPGAAEAGPGDPCTGTGPAVAKSVGPEGGLADVVVLVANAPALEAKSPQLQVSAQRCRFQPAVAAARVGTRLVAANRDRQLHTFHLRRQNTEGARSNWQNLVVPPGEPPVSWVLDEPGTLHISSDDVPGMESWALVYEQGQAVVSDAEGRFELPELPAGQWDVQFWHPRFGATVLPVLVPKDGLASLYASLPPSL